MNFLITAYCACVICCTHSHGITKSGLKAEANITAACSKQMFGKIIHVEGLGMFFCEDTGKAIKGNRIDIYFETHQEAKDFGWRKAEVRVLGSWKK